MGGGEWKVAYADFTTAMMAFFLLMWLLNAVPKETLEGIASYFQPDVQNVSNAATEVSDGPTGIIIKDKLDTREFEEDEIQRSRYAIMQSLKKYVNENLQLSPSSGLEVNNNGVLLKLTSNLVFKKNTTEFTEAGTKVLNEVLATMQKYKSYLVVRGHTDTSETGEPTFASKWDLSSARANAATEYLIAHGANPNLIRSVAYADTKPLKASNIPGAFEANSRVEFSFHRPEVMSITVGN